MTRPQTPPEGLLIERARKTRVPRTSQRDAADMAGLSEGRWRQIVAGYQSMSAGVYATVRAPAETLARMARAVGVTSEQLRAVGRDDAAEVLSSDIVERETPGGFTVRGEPSAADDPEVLSFAEEILQEALRLARSRRETSEKDPNG